MADLFANQVHAIFQPTTIVIPILDDKRIRVLGIATEQRSSLMPDVPTLAEQGFPQLIANSWNGLCAPAGTPAPIVDRLNKAALEALNSAELKAKFGGLGITIIAGSPEQFGAFMRQEAVRWDGARQGGEDAEDLSGTSRSGGVFDGLPARRGSDAKRGDDRVGNLAVAACAPQAVERHRGRAIFGPTPGGMATARAAGARGSISRITFQTARQASISAPGNHRHPAAVTSCPPRKQIEEGEAPQSAGAERRTRGRLRSGLSLHRKGLPARNAGRRALRRFTAVISVEPSPTRSGRAFVPARLLDRPSSRAPCDTGR